VPFRCGVFGGVSGFSVTLQNNRLGWIDIASDNRRSQFKWTITAFGRSRPAADASREVVERWLLDGLR